MKRAVCIVISLILIVTMVGCNGVQEQTQGGQVQRVQSQTTGHPLIDDINIFVDNQIYEWGERYIAFCFENNSSYTITYFELISKINEGVTKEELDEKFNWWTGNESDYNYDNDVELKDVHAYYQLGEYIINGLDSNGVNSIRVEPGQISEMQSVKRGPSWYDLENIEELDMMYNDFAIIGFINDDGKLQEVRYDYKNKNYTLGDKTYD